VTCDRQAEPPEVAPAVIDCLISVLPGSEGDAVPVGRALCRRG